jgi:hypothetical protein
VSGNRRRPDCLKWAFLPGPWRGGNERASTREVRVGSNSEVGGRYRDVRFTSESRLKSDIAACPKGANSGSYGQDRFEGLRSFGDTGQTQAFVHKRDVLLSLDWQILQEVGKAKRRVQPQYESAHLSGLVDFTLES